MKAHTIKSYIENKQIERDEYLFVWKELQKMHIESNFTEDTYKELQAKFSSEINKCERSIKDHE